MDILILIGGIVIIIILANLRGRVQRLEHLIAGSAAQTATGTNRGEPLSQNSQSPIPASLLLYIRERLAQGAAREEIKTTLIANGWNTPAVEKALDTILASATGDYPLASASSLAMDAFVEWLKKDWLLKLGALLLLIGFGWLTTYAFLNNWIGPMGRIVLGVFAGTGFLLLGWWRIKKYVHQGEIFLVLGSTVVLLTLFAAREIYDFFTPLSVLVVMFLSTAFVALVSVKCNNRSLALASLTLAGIAPLLTNAPTPDYIALFSYLFVVILGSLWIVATTGRRELTTAAMILITLYSLPHLFSYASSDTGALLLFAYAFAALFFVTNTVGILRLNNREIVPDLVTAGGNGLLLLAWIMTAAPDEWQSLIIAAWMVVFAMGAFLLYRMTGRREPFYVYAGVGIAMLAAATSVELDGASLTLAYTIESGLIALLTYAVLRDVRIAEQTIWLLVGPILLSFGSMTSSAWTLGLLHKDFFVLLVLAITLLGLGLYFLKPVRDLDDKEMRQINSLLLVLGSLYAYALLWLSLGAALDNDNTAVMIALTIYTIIGLIFYFFGLAKENKGIQLYGGMLVGFVVGRLLLVDVWRMELTGRIATFFLIGALLVSTAFLGKKKHHTTLANPTPHI